MVGFLIYPDTQDPLALIVERITSAPAMSQSRLLMRILDTLVYGRGEFRHAEIAALDAPTLALVMHVANLRAAGTRPDQDWANAVAAASAASV